MISGEIMSCLDPVEDLLRAFAARDLGAIRDLADAGLDLDATGGGGLTTLMRAVLRGDSVAVEWILAAGADSDASTTDGKTAVDFANAMGRHDLVELLSAAGASVGVASDDDVDEVEASCPLSETARAKPKPAAQRQRTWPIIRRSRPGRWVDKIPDAFADQFEDIFDDRLL